MNAVEALFWEGQIHLAYHTCKVAYRLVVTGFLGSILQVARVRHTGSLLSIKHMCLKWNGKPFPRGMAGRSLQNTKINSTTSALVSKFHLVI